MAEFLSSPFLRRFQFSMFFVTFVAICPKQFFIVRCPTFLFSKQVRSLVELLSSGYINCDKCLAVKCTLFTTSLLTHTKEKASEASAKHFHLALPSRSLPIVPACSTMKKKREIEGCEPVYVKYDSCGVYCVLMHLFIVLNRLLFLITHLNAQWNGTTGHY